MSLAVEGFVPDMDISLPYLSFRLERNCFVRSFFGLLISSFAEPFSKIIPLSMNIAISATSLARLFIITGG